MISNGWKVFATASLWLGGVLVACVPAEDAGECTASKPCTQRGQVCDEAAQECVTADLDIDRTGDAAADFTNVPVPFFRGKVCAATSVRPGDVVPVKVSPCLHPCVDGKGYAFKKQYSCIGSACESLVLVYYPAASGTGCPADAFGKFDRSMCVYPTEMGAEKPITASAGPFNIDSGPVSGTATVEVPFLANADIAMLLPLEEQLDARVKKTWELAKQYPQVAERVFQVSMSASNPAAPADCVDESKCTCREIGF